MFASGMRGCQSETGIWLAIRVAVCPKRSSSTTRISCPFWMVMRSCIQSSRMSRLILARECISLVRESSTQAMDRLCSKWDARRYRTEKLILAAAAPKAQARKYFPLPVGPSTTKLWRLVIQIFERGLHWEIGGMGHVPDAVLEALSAFVLYKL